jgi:hypothetical protein
MNLIKVIFKFNNLMFFLKGVFLSNIPGTATIDVDISRKEFRWSPQNSVRVIS